MAGKKVGKAFSTLISEAPRLQITFKNKES